MVVGHEWSPKTSLEGMCWLLSGWNETKSTLWVFGLLKQAATLDIASIDTGQCLKPPFEAFTSLWIHPCYNQPRVGRLKFRLETNSTVVWLYSGGVSLILPDVRFGTDWVTNELIHRHAHTHAHIRTHTHTLTSSSNNMLTWLWSFSTRLVQSCTCKAISYTTLRMHHNLLYQ